MGKTSTILHFKDLITGKEYDIIQGTGYIFNKEDQTMYMCTDDAHEASYHSDMYLEFKTDPDDDVSDTVKFYILERYSFEEVKGWATVIDIIERTNETT